MTTPILHDTRTDAERAYDALKDGSAYVKEEASGLLQDPADAAWEAVQAITDNSKDDGGYAERFIAGFKDGQAIAAALNEEDDAAYEALLRSVVTRVATILTTEEEEEEDTDSIISILEAIDGGELEELPVSPLRKAAQEMDRLGISVADFARSLPTSPVSDAEMLHHMQRFLAGYKAGQAIALGIQTERHTHYSDTHQPYNDPWTTYTLREASIDVHDSGCILNICIGREMLEIEDKQQVRDLMTLLDLTERPPFPKGGSDGDVLAWREQMRHTGSPLFNDLLDWIDSHFPPLPQPTDPKVRIKHRIDDEGSPSVEYTARTVELVQDFNNPPSFGPFTLYIRGHDIPFDGPLTVDMIGEIMIDISYLLSNDQVCAALDATQ